MSSQRRDTSKALSVTMAQHLLDLLVWQGLDERQLVTDIGRARDQLDDGSGWVSLTTGRAILQAALKQRHDPVLLLRMSHITFPTGFGTVGHLLQACPTLQDAIDALIRFEPLISGIGRSHFRRENERFLWGFYCEADDELVVQQITDFIMGARYRFLMMVHGDRDKFVKAVHFMRPAPERAEDLQLFHKIFHCAVLFSQDENLIVMDEEAPSLPLRQADSSLKPLIEEQARKKMEAIGKSDSLSETAQKQLRILMQEGQLSRELLAERLGVSARHLHRQLEAAGTSYRELVDGLRLEIAKESLAKEDLSVEDVAALLSFGDGQSFVRWFKQTTLQTPREYREALRSQK